MSVSDPRTPFEGLNSWLREVRQTNKMETYKARKTDANRFAYWCGFEDVVPAEASSRDVHRYLISLLDIYSESTTKGAYDALSGFYGWLASPVAPEEFAREEDATEDLARKKYKPRREDGGPDADPMEEDDEIVYVSAEEVDVLAEHAPAPGLKSELMIRLMYQTGVRQSELVRIQLEKINRDEREIRVRSPKTDDWRTVYYKPSLDFLLRRWIESERQKVNTAPESPFLFPGPRTKRHRPDYVNGVVTAAAENAGIQEVKSTDASGREQSRITSHSLRHGFAVRAVKSGMNIVAVRDLLGHADIETTQVYLQFSDGDTKQQYAKW